MYDAFNGLFGNMSTARKLFRLFKSFNEYQKIRNFINTPRPSDEAGRKLDIICRLGFMFYWLFDNIGVLIKVKFFTFAELKDIARIASKCWLFGIITGIITAIR